ncbi:ATP phosphoribosyltransferase [Treponema parvum]|uniref:ATP phosphoribosyltransferase n=1 Tax=Treponema parvum TaxID=138851 RepID=A0A975ICF4_9SPIR|nr:ATP phosphoribosyltransferase [Treponema parvum]QTQ11039.1 ATP phosphoribosyltransferase [Treponema parvum]QTQ17016.1 ATP phosphoribosyltransferase [Treponema parvum]
MEKLKILLPKGRIYENVVSLLSGAGIKIDLPERAYRPTVNQDDLEAKVMKPQNIGKLLELGSHDVGFTGRDWIMETGADVEEIMDLGFDRVRIVAAVPNSIDDKTLTERRVIVATEYEQISRRWLENRKMNFLIVRTYGATEVFPPDDADMIIDNTATGRTLAENGLRIVDTILVSSTCMFASKKAMKDPAKKQKILELKMLFEAVINARDRVMLEMNCSKEKFEALVKGLPAMRSPTVAPLYGDSGYAIKIAVKKGEVPVLLPQLRELGATDILEYELRKVL